jgi:hypothetical protein
VGPSANQGVQLAATTAHKHITVAETGRITVGHILNWDTGPCPPCSAATGHFGLHVDFSLSLIAVVDKVIHMVHSTKAGSMHE